MTSYKHLITNKNKICLPTCKILNTCQQVDEKLHVLCGLNHGGFCTAHHIALFMQSFFNLLHILS